MKKLEVGGLAQSAIRRDWILIDEAQAGTDFTVLQCMRCGGILTLYTSIAGMVEEMKAGFLGVHKKCKEKKWLKSSG